MPHWLATLLIIAASITTLLTAAGVVRAKIVGPLTAAWAEVIGIFRRLLTAAELIQKFAAEMQGMSGAFTLFAVGIKQEVDEHGVRLTRVEEMRDLVIDLQADLERHLRDPGGHA